MAVNAGKRKREDKHANTGSVKKAAVSPGTSKAAPVHSKQSAATTKPVLKSTAAGEATQDDTTGPVNVQIVTGSYDRVLHGLTATFSNDFQETRDVDASFADTFLFAAHTSSIRCLALSPPTESHKRVLASGGSDEQIKLYSISTSPPGPGNKPSTPSLLNHDTAENSSNREIGSLLHHDRAVTCMRFPTKSKLFSAAEDSTIAISRTRDWTVLSTIKAPIPKAQGRPSGDTAGPGEVPAGVNDFAVHPSSKLMLSVGRGERNMRLWNLMTGKKAGVLNFDKSLLMQVGEGKYSSGEGRKVLWDESGELFVVGFERGIAVFGIECKPRAIIRPEASTKLHQMRFLMESILAVSTEDGRILFYNLAGTEESETPATLPARKCMAQLDGHASGLSGRIKDFEILKLPGASKAGNVQFLIVTCGSDGAIRLWILSSGDLLSAAPPNGGTAGSKTNTENPTAVAQVGKLIGTHETGNRITCLAAFIMEGIHGGQSLKT